MISLLVLFLPLSTSLPLLGWVESPGYPRGYPNEAKLEWKRCAPPGHTLYLTLTHLDLEESDECKQDAVEISSDERKLVSLCGRKSYEELQSSVNPSLQSSISGCLMLSFRSDYSNTQRHSGFRAFYTVQDVDECVDPDNACNQFCGNYIGGYRCSCQIKTPTHQFGPFCGNVPPPSPLLTRSHQVEILFSSDGDGTNSGFFLSYKTTAKTCPSEVTPNSRVNPQKPQYRQGEEVTVTCDLGHSSPSNDPEYRSVCQSTGIWSPVFPCQTVDCGIPDIPEDEKQLLQLSGPSNGTLYQAQVRFECNSTYYTLEPNGERDIYTLCQLTPEKSAAAT